MTKKIMFNDDFCLTQAVLCGAKTMTRRVLKEGTPLGNWEETIKHLPYKVGEVVAIAQSYKEVYPNADFEMIGDKFMTESAGWNNKMFVKSSLMPHHIRITDVKVERLQDISENECLKEGIKLSNNGRFYFHQMVAYKLSINKYFDTPREAFAYLIDKISGKGTWESNPWVVAYSFELVD